MFLIYVALVSVGGTQAFGAGFPDTRSETNQPSSGETSPDSSPVIGGGIRNPPDIGAAGTGTVQDTIRSESPTDEPSIVPSITPPLSEKSDTSEAQTPKEPLGHPDVFPDGKKDMVPEPGLNK